MALISLFRAGCGQVIARDTPVYSGLGAEISSFDCALLPRHGPVLRSAEGADP